MMRESRPWKNFATWPGSMPLDSAQPVELQVDGEQRVHQLEVDLPGATLERAGVNDVLADVGQGFTREVVRLEVAEAELELPFTLFPDRVEVLEERREISPDAGGTEAELPFGRRRDLSLVGEWSPHSLHEPLARRQRQEVRRDLRRPRAAVGDEQVAER